MWATAKTREDQFNYDGLKMPLKGRFSLPGQGYRPDVPISSQLDERAHNVVLMANEVQNQTLLLGWQKMAERSGLKLLVDGK